MSEPVAMLRSARKILPRKGVAGRKCGSTGPSVKTGESMTLQTEPLTLQAEHIALRALEEAYAGDYEAVEIHQRRYLGNKAGVLDLIDEVLTAAVGEFDSLCDIFAGTGTVSQHNNSPAVQVIANDILFSNYIPLYAWLSPEPCNWERVFERIQSLNKLEAADDNYVSEHFGGTFFSLENARRIGAVREQIEHYTASAREKAVLLSSLIYAMDRVANTVGHYDAFRSTMDSLKPLELRPPLIRDACNERNAIYNDDANALIGRIECDVLYLDPPYNSRQYCDLYHVLENVVRWQKPSVFGKAKKFDRKALKSKYNCKEAYRAMADLISRAEARCILLSYNNMGSKGDPRSNARIADSEILELLERRGQVEIFEHDYRAFTTGKTAVSDNKERIFFCEVKKNAPS